MKSNHLFTSMLAVVALLAASCSAPKMAQNKGLEDDVYNTTARAKEYKPAELMPNYQPQYDSDSTVYDDYYGRSDASYDMDYSSRIDRFYYGNPSRGYYDPYYNYYGYNSYYGFNNYNYGGLGLGGYWGWNNWYAPFGGGIYGGLGYSPYWGPYSAYNYWGTGYWGGGYWGGGNWGGGNWGGGYVGRNDNYRPRPTRAPRSDGNYGVPSTRGGVGGNAMGRPTRAENYNPGNGGARTSGRPQQGSSNPSTGRPSRQTETRPTYTPPTRSDAPASRPTYTPPPSNSGSGSSGSSSGSSSGGGGARTGGRGGRG